MLTVDAPNLDLMFMCNFEDIAIPADVFRLF